VSAASNLTFEPAAEVSFPNSAMMLRQWCAPEKVLAVTTLADEETLLFHLLRQVRPGGAKVLLVHAVANRASSCCGKVLQLHRNAMVKELARQSLNRMARQLRWVGIACEPVLLKGTAAEEIAILAKARSVDRVLIAARSGKHGLQETLAEELAPALEVPVCIVPERLSPGVAGEKATGRILLALSLRSDCEMPLAFASRLAQKQNAKLVVMHVFSGGDSGGLAPFGRSPKAVLSRLPYGTLREAELFCRMEIAVREGDPAGEILRYQAETKQDFIILDGPRAHGTAPPHHASTVHRIVTGAQCPVILLGRSTVPGWNVTTMAGSSKPPQREFIR
jgi:nucleotide-binding universal stress UspA family protein